MQGHVEQQDSNEVKRGVDDPNQLNALAIAAENRFDALDLLKNHAITMADIDRDLKRNDLTPNDLMVDTFLKDNFTALTALEPYKSKEQKSSGITQDDLSSLELVTTPGGITKLGEQRQAAGEQSGVGVALLADFGLIMGGIALSTTEVGGAWGIPMGVTGIVGAVGICAAGMGIGQSVAQRAFRDESNYYNGEQQQALQLVLPAPDVGKLT